MALFLLAVAIWMVLRPDWWLEMPEDVADSLHRFASLWSRPAIPISLRNDRRTRAAIRLMGVFLALVAAAHFYREIQRILSR
jgi:hypothetical protein